MEFHQIRYFLAACDHLNFTRAAEACAVSQPALTVAIQKLEADLGAPLFLRTGRQIEMTDLGRSMRLHFARIEQSRSAARAAARQMIDGETAPIELGIMCTIGPALFAPAFAAWRTQGNAADLILHNVWGDRMYELLLSGAIDCAIVASRTVPPPGISLHEVMVEPVELAVGLSHPLASRERISIPDLKGHNYIDRLHCEFREDFFEQLHHHEMAIDVILRSEREDWIQQAVRDGLGISFLPRNSVIADGIVTRAVEGVDVRRPIQIATVRDRPIRAPADSFIAFLKNADWTRPREN